MKTEELYRTSEDFKRYVDAYATKHRITIETAMTHKLVKNVADSMKAKAEVRKDDRRRSSEVHQCDS